MNLKPSENTRIYGMKNFFNELVGLYEQKKMPNRILLSGKKGLGKSTLAYHLINYILSQNEEYKYNLENFSINKDNRSYKLLQNNSHPNFYLIDLLTEKKSIDVGQIREMINYTNKSTFNNMVRFILIDNVENLNKNSVNALLKIIEEPNDNVFFILINNSEKDILPTLKSRCLTFKINLTFNESLNISNLILKKNVLEFVNYDLLSYYNSPGDTINLFNFAEEKSINLKDHTISSFIDLIIENNYYKKNKPIKVLLINLIELFFLKKYVITDTKISLVNFYHKFIKKIYYTEKFNLDEESLFLEFKSKFL
ncbi:AAA family ATPase [Candidatus Pelagibacter sp. Uisw_134_02]|uniref:AAA family ATPase n=1 Tax=Candidatus Pelagibacter sp. Uisw_134_02 TaxID=3230990 RepID=UPI0039E72D30